MGKYSFDSSSLNSALSSTVATQWPLFGQGRPIHFWADKGLVRWEDERDDAAPHKKRGLMVWQDAAKRVIGLSEMVVKSSEDRRWAHERQKLQQFVTEMESVIRQAKEQGGPLDGASVHRDYARRRPTTVVKPTIVNLD